MADPDITLEILRDIRDSIRTVDKKVSSTNERISMTNDRIDDTNSRLEALTLGVTSRLDAIDRTLTELAAQIFMLGRYVKNRVAAEIDELKLRVTKIESGS